MAYTRNPTWQDYDGTDDTLITAAKLNHLEDGVEAAAAAADAASQPSTAQAINAQTGAYTLIATDAGKMVEMTLAAGADLSVPGSVFTAGQRVDVLDVGAGRVTFVGTSGMTLNGVPSLVSSAQWSGFTIFFRSATTAVVVGRLA